MSAMHLYHVLPSKFPYGAYSMLFELHYAINKYHSNEVKQSIFHLKPPKDGAAAFFTLPSSLITPENFSKVIEKDSRSVVLFHKLWASDCEPTRKSINDKCPFFILNHTQTSNPIGINKSNGIFTVSKDMRSTFLRRFPKSKIHFIRNGVNQCRYDAVPQKASDDLGKYFVTGRMNNFNECKHPKDWITFCGKMNLSKPMWHDYLGSGQHLPLAQGQWEKMKRKGCRNFINLTGRIDDFEAKVGYIKRWQAFLYEIPGTEGTSMSLLESLACGVPAVINNKPGNCEIIRTGSNGIVYPGRNRAIDFLNEFCRDEKALKQLSESTKKDFAKHLDARYAAKSYVDILKESI